jgi:biopolymer transport protein ExbD
MAGGGSTDGRSPRIDLVPIIDAMTCVIFFLLLSSTFIEFTKITMPPAVGAAATAVETKEQPISPKLIGVIKGNAIHLVLSWKGESPDSILKKVMRDENNEKSEELQAQAEEAVIEFKKRFPKEQSLLLGFSPGATYQEVISTMDGARKVIPDLVMISWTESQVAETQIKE